MSELQHAAKQVASALTLMCEVLCRVDCVSELTGSQPLRKPEQQALSEQAAASPVCVSLDSFWSSLPKWRLSSICSQQFSAWQKSGNSQKCDKADVGSLSGLNGSKVTRTLTTYIPDIPCSKVMKQVKQSVFETMDNLPRIANMRGCPWPSMEVSRRSALRWQVDWHGLVWPAMQQVALELHLDNSY